MYALECEIPIVCGVVAAVRPEGRVADADRRVLEAWLAQPHGAPRSAAPAAVPPTISCFINYSSRDEAITRCLHADLQANDVPSWFALHDMRIGDRLIDRIN